MPSMPAGSAVVKVTADVEGFRSELRAALFAIGARDVLVQFSEWLDGDQKMLKRPWCGGDVRTAEQLVDQFIEEQVARMRDSDD